MDDIRDLIIFFCFIVAGASFVMMCAFLFLRKADDITEHLGKKMIKKFIQWDAEDRKKDNVG